MRDRGPICRIGMDLRAGGGGGQESSQIGYALCSFRLTRRMESEWGLSWGGAADKVSALSDSFLGEFAGEKVYESLGMEYLFEKVAGILDRARGERRAGGYCADSVRLRSSVPVSALKAREALSKAGESLQARALEMNMGVCLVSLLGRGPIEGEFGWMLGVEEEKARLDALEQASLLERGIANSAETKGWRRGI